MKTASWVSLAVLVAIGSSGTGQAREAQTPGLAKPLLPVIGQINVEPSRGQGKALSAAELQVLAANYAGIELPPRLLPEREQLAQLKAQNPEFLVLPYLNSSSAPPNWMQGLERDRFHTIGLYWEASLTEEIGPADQMLKLKPADPARGLRLKASTTREGQSRDGMTFVSFVRLDDELMHVESVDAAAGTISVSRGTDGTVAARHAANARVFAPVYVGSTGEWVGTPGKSQRGVRYAMQIESDQVARLLADNITEFMGRGADGAWLDICSPSFYNLANAFGEQVTPWDFAANAEFDPRSRKKAQELKLQRIQTYVHEATGAWPALTANNNGNGDYFEDRGGAADFVRPTDIKPRPIRAVILEAAFSYHAKNEYSKFNAWKANLSTLIHGAQNKLPVWPWLKSYPIALRPATESEDAMALYDYASVLLGWEFGSGAAIVTEALADDGQGGRAIYLPRFWYYDLGKPVDRVEYDNIEKLRAAGHRSFVRRWTGGIVLVNPTDQVDEPIELEDGYSDPNTGDPVRRIQLQPHTGSILLRNAG